MKASELMIGDWVQYPYGIRKVTELDSFLDRVCSEDFSVGEVDAIPLTPEILENNGFVFLIDTWYLQTEERKPIHIRFMDGFIAISIKCNIIPMGLKYVHELQHALRLCGIDKEIVL